MSGGCCHEIKTWQFCWYPFLGCLSDLQRLGMKKSRSESPAEVVCKDLDQWSDLCNKIGRGSLSSKALLGCPRKLVNGQ